MVASLERRKRRIGGSRLVEVNLKWPDVGKGVWQRDDEDWN